MMTREFRLFGKGDVTWSKKRLNTDVVTCAKCGTELREGDSTHKQRRHYYHAACWLKAYLDTVDLAII